MTVRTSDMAINERELATVLAGLAVVPERIAAVVAADMFSCVRNLRERARTGKLTAEETKILRGE